MFFINTTRSHNMELFLIPLQLLIIIGFVFRQNIVNRIRDPFRKNFNNFANKMKFKTDNKLKTLLIPIVVTIIVYIVFVKLVGFFYTPLSDLLFTLDSVILAPISEQILQVLFLLVLSFIFTTVYKNKWVVCLVALTISSLLLAAMHFPQNLNSWIIHFSSFVIYGVLYYLNKENLLPSIVAHSAWNIIILNPIPF